ncbi:uncharacterized protein KNAG_0E03880 [Huiozyma naganishii CBS 8797]|uniref:L-lactate dehydrogenase (cytochrome) n=1 Tax=Huiozyma naganishii (strain ATCC MYA-139 / BCRC 22969 / CBS 8797 / KCTC 17520 / NBRC 10181 / NCYC 3082 / Yp74L-3) TaxID=1071383 RepID=J7RZJ9_HUIN7|nr:hypothetical protein KNAG_0E03880 [Kazachstania naganishii CBS 8797]CCK70642.1 hypothetical protein KNAG_0E03880 [Kazachstania naganishii CBS 8797]
MLRASAIGRKFTVSAAHRTLALGIANRTIHRCSYSTGSPTTKSTTAKRRVKYFATATIIAGSILFYSQHERHNNFTNDSAVIPQRKVTAQEVLENNWTVIDGCVYDLSNFANTADPSAVRVIKSNGGKDITSIYFALFGKTSLDNDIFKKQYAIGILSGKMPSDRVVPKYSSETRDEVIRKEILKNSLPPLANIINVYDFENLASKFLPHQAWAYYSSGSDDEISLRENHSAYHRIFFKPRVLVDVSNVDTSTTLLGKKVDIPIFVAATALMQLGNPEKAEVNVAKGCGQAGLHIPQMISTFSSNSIEDITAAKSSDKQAQWFQLYVNGDRKVTKDLIQKVEALGLDALFVTVDVPLTGHREKDLKIKFSTADNGPSVAQKKKKDTKQDNGASKALTKFIDPSLSWNDIIEFKKHTKLPIVLKGIQRAEDVVKAAELGLAGVVISNHGGRQLDFARAPVEVLAESVPELEKRGLRSDNFELFIDGGIRRGTDILKALCLGAKGVGLGRPFMYANSCYGEEGVEKAISLLKEEVETSMRLLGVTSIDQLGPDLLDLSTLRNRSVSVARDSLFADTYKTPTLADFTE